MARLVISGGEVRDHPTTNVGSPDGWSGGTTLRQTDTTNQRGGSACFKYPGSAGNGSYSVWQFTAPASGASVFARCNSKFSTLPSGSAKKILALLTSADGALVSARLTSAGKLQLWNDAAGAQIGSDSALTIATGVYYRIQLQLTIAAGATDAARLRVVAAGTIDEEEEIAGTSLTISDTHASRLRSGWIDAPGLSADCYDDGIAVNNSTGTAENSWPGAGLVLLSKAVQTIWTASTATDCSGASPNTGGVNLAEALNNTPPVGVADHTNAAHAGNPDQVRQTSTSTISIYCQTLAALGIPSDIGFETAEIIATDTGQIGSGSTSGTSGDQVAQSFDVPAVLQALDLDLEKVGSPTDDLVVELVEDNSGVPSATVIESWTIPAADVPVASTDKTSVRCALAQPIAVHRTLWIVARRSGANNGSNYYTWRTTPSTSAAFLAGSQVAYKRSGSWTATYATRNVQIRTASGLRTPKVLVGWLCHGEAIATGTKTLSGFDVRTSMTKASTPQVSANIGNDAGAAGTYPTNWTWTPTSALYRPTPTDGSDLMVGGMRLAMSIASAGRFSLLCFAGVYLEVDETYTSEWVQFQKTSDSSIWWGKQAVAETTYECGDPATTLVTVMPGSWAMYPSPQIDAGQNFPTTLESVTDETIQSSYTRL
jgi:hypothetical protein